MTPPQVFGLFGLFVTIGGIICGGVGHLLNWAVDIMNAEEAARGDIHGPDLHEVTELWELYPEAVA